jgi:DNA polymerase epsilon subunit 1
MNFEEFFEFNNTNNNNNTNNTSDPFDCLVDMREYDVPYVIRVAIDLDIRVGAWFSISPEEDGLTCTVTWEKEILALGEPRIMAFDIECEKAPLKFPNADHDRVFMISYMMGQQGYLIINRYVRGD